MAAWKHRSCLILAAWIEIRSPFAQQSPRRWSRPCGACGLKLHSRGHRFRIPWSCPPTGHVDRNWVMPVGMPPHLRPAHTGQVD